MTMITNIKNLTNTKNVKTITEIMNIIDEQIKNITQSEIECIDDENFDIIEFIRKNQQNGFNECNYIKYQFTLSIKQNENNNCDVCFYIEPKIKSSYDDNEYFEPNILIYFAQNVNMFDLHEHIQNATQYTKIGNDIKQHFKNKYDFDNVVITNAIETNQMTEFATSMTNFI